MTASTLDASAVAQVVLRERQSSDRGWHDAMATAYWPDSTVHVTWYGGDGPGYVAASRERYRTNNRALHRTFAPVVRVTGDRAHTEMSTMNTSQVTVEGVQADLTSFMRLNYRLERRSGEWRILSLDVIYETSRLTPSVPGETVRVPAAELAPYRPAYALLAWRLAQTGVTVSDSELGEDRPQEVAAFYERVEHWLEGHDE
jgi:hypothetical protein